MTEPGPTTCVDTGVAVAAFASWHERHQDAVVILAGDVRMAAHSMVETYSVLTRLPTPYRAPANVVSQFLADRFTSPPIQLTAADIAQAMSVFASSGIRGGTAYDGLIGLTAARHGLRLVTFDRRAAWVYRAVGCAYELA